MSRFISADLGMITLMNAAIVSVAASVTAYGVALVSAIVVPTFTSSTLLGMRYGTKRAQKAWERGWRRGRDDALVNFAREVTDKQVN